MKAPAEAEAEPTEQPESSEPITPEPATPETEAVPEESEPQEAESEALTEPEAETPEAQASEAEPVTSIEELPETLDGLAEALEQEGITGDALLEHFKVQLPGSDQTITLKEAVRGFLREDTFTRKTTELADDRTRFATQMQEQQTATNGRIEALDTAVTAVRNLMGEQPDAATMAALARDDPERYAQINAQQIAVEAALTEADKAKNEAVDGAKAENQTRLAEYRDQQQKALLDARPELKDPKTLEKFQAAMAETLRARGFSDQEIVDWANGPYDHRHILLTEDAMKWRATQAAKPEVEKKLPKPKRVLKPKGSVGTRNAATQMSTLQESLLTARSPRDQHEAGRALIRAKLAKR
tara:strand:+ start:946 stop:2013 length:1068 start_codon:yes stop_codon:yes gene_type:complete